MLEKGGVKKPVKRMSAAIRDYELFFLRSLLGNVTRPCHVHLVIITPLCDSTEEFCGAPES